MNDSGQQLKVPLHDKCASIMLNPQISQLLSSLAFLLYEVMHITTAAFLSFRVKCSQSQSAWGRDKAQRFMCFNVSDTRGESRSKGK